MNIKIINNYKTDENTYIVYNDKIAIVIDPGNKTEEILNVSKEINCEIKYILLTHCHYDHIEFLDELKNKTGAKVGCGKNCAENVIDSDINLSTYGLGRTIIPQKPEIIINDGEEYDFEGIKVKCIYTPGHTNCSVCYLINNDIFTGDTLFLRSCGRWDLPTGSGKTIIKSIKEKLFTLDENIKVYPGHGKSSDIGYEKKFNIIVN